MDHCSLHPSRSLAAVQTSWAVRFVALRTYCSQLLSGLTGFCLQPGSGVVSLAIQQMLGGRHAFWQASDVSKAFCRRWPHVHLYVLQTQTCLCSNACVAKSAHPIPQVCSVLSLYSLLASLRTVPVSSVKKGRLDTGCVYFQLCLEALIRLFPDVVESSKYWWCYWCYSDST